VDHFGRNLTDAKWANHDKTIITKEDSLRDERIVDHATSGTFSSKLRIAKRICEPDMFK
jgi:hypothetical protein